MTEFDKVGLDRVLSGTRSGLLSQSSVGHSAGSSPPRVGYLRLISYHLQKVVT